MAPPEELGRWDANRQALLDFAPTPPSQWNPYQAGIGRKASSHKHRGWVEKCPAFTVVIVVLVVLVVVVVIVIVVVAVDVRVVIFVVGLLEGGKR